MKGRLPFFIIITFLLALIDLFNWGALSSISHDTEIVLSVRIIYLIIITGGFVGLYLSISRWGESPIARSLWINFLIGFAFVVLITRFVMVSGFVLQDLVRLLEGSFYALTGKEVQGFLPERREWIGQTILFISLIIFITMVYGITKGKYKFTVDRVTMYFPDLPKELDGLRLVQISDIHSGSWDSVGGVVKGIQKIKELQPDIIVFTGDLVNSDKNEIDPFIDSFATLDAPLGKYAILGNHDYYGQPRDAALRPAYYEDFWKKFEEMGWDLILNDNRRIKHNNTSFRLLGVENWGHGRYFPKRGDLNASLTGVQDDEFCILLSHDPTHWEEKVLMHNRHIPLTLSGHTHGMQFGLNTSILKWSPIQYRYKRWIGAYEEASQKLYVNRGFGYLAFPGRVGMWAEITEITLKSGLSKIY